MKYRSLSTDRRRRAVTLDGRTTVLQEKSWQVLQLLLAQAPNVVTRTDIVDAIWPGNNPSGEKGLNQAIWTIRAALDDNAREPEFIRTIPRVGYQWIHPPESTGTPIDSEPLRGRAPQSYATIGTVAATALLTAVIGYSAWNGALQDFDPAPGATARIATKAYLVDRDIHVEFASGCLGILKNESNKNIGPPMLSADGTEVAVTVHEQGGCRLVTVDVRSGERHDFDSCPAS